MTLILKKVSAWLKANGKPALNWLGLLLGLVGAVLVGRQIWNTGEAFLTAITNPSIIWLAIFAAIVYGASRYLVFFSWFSIINSMTKNKVTISSGIYISATMNLLKYLPGNMAHHAWRTMALHQRGIDLAANLWSSLLATLSLTATSLTMALAFGGPLVLAMAPDPGPVWLAVLAVAGTFVLAKLFLLARRSERLRGALIRLAGPRTARAMAVSFAVQAIFFLVNGSAIWMIVTVLYPEVGASFDVIMAAFAGSWITGFLTPGAPAGVGVREAVMVLILTQASALSGGEAAVIALLTRLVSMLGDALFAIPALTAVRGRGSNAA